jgi:hypothetical protein
MKELYILVKETRVHESSYFEVAIVLGRVFGVNYFVE